jgi:hypothetical protein
MQLIITEAQYKTIIMEYYEKNRPYLRDEVIKGLKNAPGYIKSYIRNLPRFYVRDNNGNPYMDVNGNKLIFTNIPEIVYDYLHGKF